MLRRVDKEQHVHHVFESIAHKYDTMNNILSLRRHKAWRSLAMRKMQVKANDQALDICCGTCDWTLALDDASQGGRIIGLDFSQTMLDYGQQKINRAGAADRIQLIAANAMELPYENDSFDHVTIGFALRNVPDLEQVIAEMVRVAKPGGQVVSLELSKPTLQPMKSLYNLYLHRILPLMGKWFAKRYEQYKWLPESLISFPGYEQLGVIFREQGLEGVQVYPLSGGIAALHIGKKPYSIGGTDA